jgi:hypothetical protein
LCDADGGQAAFDKITRALYAFRLPKWADMTGGDGHHSVVQHVGEVTTAGQ